MIRCCFALLTTMVAAAVLQAQFQGYNNPSYAYPDAATGARGWRSWASNGVWSLGVISNVSAAVQVSASGTVSSGSGTADLGNAAYPWRSNFLWGGLVLASNAAVTFGDGTVQTTAAGGVYRIGISGTNATLNPGFLRWADGTVSGIGAQSVGLFPGSTNYLGIDLFDLTLHNYPRALDMGTKWLAQVVVDGAGNATVTSWASDADAPPNRIEGVKQKLLDGSQPVSVAVLGDSISGPYPAYITNWVDTVFNQPLWSSNLFLPHTAVWSVSNYAIGTQTPSMGMCQIGSAVTPPFTATSGNLGFASQIYGDLSGTAPGSPVLDSQPDLVIIGYYNSGQSYKLPYTERLVQRARGRGCAVILHSTEANQAVSLQDRQSEGPVLRTIADQHGALFLDTWARAFEARNLKGVTLSPPGDQLHPNDTGQLLWAAWLRSVVPGFRQKSERIPASPILVSLPATPAAQLALPYGMESEFQFYNIGGYTTNIAYFNVAAFNSANPAIFIGNRPAVGGAVALPAGGTAVFSHPHALTFSLLVDGAANAPSGFSYTITVGPTTIATGNFSNVGPRPAILEILNVEQMRALSASLYNFGKADVFENLALAVNVTAGTAVIYGGVWGVPAKREVPLSALSYSGTGWDLLDKAGDNAATAIRGTDTANDAVRFTFYGAGAQLLLQGGTGAGKVKIFLDGAAVTTLSGLSVSPYADLFVGATRFVPVNLFPPGGLVGNANAFSGGQHTIKVLFDGSVNAGAVTPTATKRRLAVCGATVFGPSDLLR